MTAAADNAAAAPIFPPPQSLLTGKVKPHVASFEQYKSMWNESVNNPDKFFGEHARSLLSWDTPYTQLRSGSLLSGSVAYFHNGRLNVSYNCVDRHALQNPDKVALIYEPDDPNDAINGKVKVKVTYGELLENVCKLANVMISMGLKKGDTVGIYLPNIPEAAVAMLACARLGIIHSVVFAGFSAHALRDRLNDAQCKLLITSDQGVRAGKCIQIKQIADAALSEAPSVKNVIVFKRTGDPTVNFVHGRDVWWHEIMATARPYCPPVSVDAEDPLFMLYTSGSTGKPKGLLHTTAGYLLGTVMTVKYVFDTHEGDVFGCMADVGWITGHSYIVYGPLCLGVTTVLFESIPTFPNPSRYWQLIDNHKITQFYTAPTAIRALRKFGDDPVKPYSLASLRVIGSVGEPINPEAWLWYHQVVGRERCAVVDTYWQTETGCNVLTPLPAAVATKPGSATVPFFGIEPVVVDAQTGKVLEGNDVTGVLCFKNSWPSLARTVYNDHNRYLDTYMRPYPGFYFTGDGVTRDKDGYYWIRGRVDDVINVSGHRMSTAEIESALVLNPGCAEAAVVGAPDELTGQKIIAFVIPKASISDSSAFTADLIKIVRTEIGPIATPKRIVVVNDLPKTRSGKIMRRVLRKIACGEADGLGDLSTLAEPGIIPVLIKKFQES